MERQLPAPPPKSTVEVYLAAILAELRTLNADKPELKPAEI